MNFGLDEGPSMTRNNLKFRRSSSCSFGKNRRTIHWISPSVFRKTNKKKSISEARPFLFTLSEVFNSSYIIPTINTNEKRRTRKRNEIRKISNEPKHRTKQMKQESVNCDFTLNRPTKPKEASMRLSYILNNDPYNVLGINPGASKTEVKNVYKKKVIETHPDKGGSKDEFIKLKTAYEILVDDKKRNIYEKYGMEGINNLNKGIPFYESP